MATLTIRDFDDDLKAALRVRAAQHGRSMESEVREILRTVLERSSSGPGMATRIRQRFTDVVSELMRKAPEPRVVSWVDRFSASDVLVTAVTAAELMYGVARLPAGRRKRELRLKVEGLLSEDFQDQILPFDAPAATHYAEIVASRERTGRPISRADARIAAIGRNGSADSRPATSMTS